jgi:hypothetical protein
MRALRHGLMAAALLATPLLGTSALAQPQQFGGGGATPPAASPPTAATPPAATPPAATPPGATPPASPGAPRAGTSTPEALAAAQELLRATGAAALAETTMAQTSQQITAALAQSSGKPAAEVQQIVEDVLMPEFRARIPELMAFTAQLWASQMTAAELRELAAFYETPLGRRLTEVTPTVASQSALFGMRWGQEVGLSALNKHRDTLRSRGLKI